MITSSSMIDSLFDEFTDELTLLKSIPLGIDETDCHPKIARIVVTLVLLVFFPSFTRALHPQLHFGNPVKSNKSLSPPKPDNDLSHTHRPTSPIIKDWVSDSEDESETKIPQNVPSFVQPTEQVKSPRHSVKHVQTSIPTSNSKTAIPKPTSNGKGRNKKAYFVCKSLDHLIKDCDYHEKKLAVLTQSKLVPLTTVVPKTSVTRPRQAKTVVTKPNSPPRRHINHSPSLNASNFPPKITVVKAPMGNPQHALKDKGVINSRCSRHMTGNMSYLSDFKELNGGYVAFGGNPKGGKIFGKGKIRIGKLDFDDVYFVKELKFNLFSVSQMCDKKNSVLFTDTECLVLSPKFKLPDENQVLLKNTDGDVAFDEKEPKSEVNVSPSSSAQSKKHDDKTKREAKGKSHVESLTGYRNLSAEFEDLSDNSINEDNADDITYYDDEDDVGAEADLNNLETSITVSPIPTTRVHKDHHVTQIIGDLSLATQTRKEPKRVHQDLKDPSWIKAMQEELLQFKMQKVWVLVDLPHGKRAIGTKWVFRNKKDERGNMVRNKARLVAQGHTQEDGLDYEEVFALVARIEAIRLFLAYASFMGFMVYQMDVKSASLYGTIKEKVYVCQLLRFDDPDYPNKVYKVVKALYGLHQAPRAWQKGDILLVQIYVDDIIFGLQVKHKKDGIFISHGKYIAKILRKFGLTDGKSASTPIDTEKPLLKDPDGEDVDVHTYRSMIGSLMYLTSSRPDIMFAICACACFHVIPKALHLHTVKRIFRYLKGKPHLGLWYLKDSPFGLVAYSDSDYAGASLDRKSTIWGCQFLGWRVIS
uniref:Uncharacterized protein n=1 Tax=Tanacetum cinerariifolium TaxID=118510 RepID=A0A6L2J1S5_TANCI|nr:hypothetical protein [Tanacetum cinerariifolium]